MNDLLSIGTAVALALTGIATQLPKIIAAMKRDKVEWAISQNQHDSVDAINLRMLKHEARMNEMDETIRKQQIKVTRLQVLVIQLKGHLQANGVDIPAQVESEIKELVEMDK